MLREAARRVAQVFDVKYIVMGHSHRAVEETVGSGTRYFNLGSWTPGRSHDGFPHVVVTAGSAELRRWKGPRPERIDADGVPAAGVPVPA
jgi:UDP-2,3-diacylglucosamine pyrophosphatase LpxH